MLLTLQRFIVDSETSYLLFKYMKTQTVLVNVEVEMIDDKYMHACQHVYYMYVDV